MESQLAARHRPVQQALLTPTGGPRGLVPLHPVLVQHLRILIGQGELLLRSLKGEAGGVKIVVNQRRADLLAPQDYHTNTLQLTMDLLLLNLRRHLREQQQR